MKIDWNKYITSKTISNLLILCGGILFYFFLLRFNECMEALGWFFSIFTPFILGFVIAYLINFFVRGFENKVFYKIKKPKTQRVLSMMAGYLVALIIVVIFFFMVIPQTVESISSFITNIPNYIENLLSLVNQVSIKYGWEDSLRIYINETLTTFEKNTPDIISWLLPYTVGITTAVYKTLLNIFIAVVVSIYFIGTKEKFIAQMKKGLYANLKKERVDNLIHLTVMTNDTFSNFISGKLLDSLIIGIICFIVMFVFKFPFALLISVIIGVTNIIPFFGPIIGAVPCFFILLIADPIMALWFLIFVIILQALDGNVIGPKILGFSVGISAIWIVFSIVIGAKLLGFIGMVIGVPVFAIIYSLFSIHTEKKLAAKGMSTKTEDYASEKNKIRF